MDEFSLIYCFFKVLEPFKKPEIPSYIPGQKDKEEMSQFRTDIGPVSKPEDTLLPKKVRQPEVSQKKAKIKDEVSPRHTPEEEEISAIKRDVISTKKEQIEITTMPKTEVKQHILHEKKGLVLTTEEVMLSQELKVAPVLKIEEKTGVLHKKEFVLTSVKQMVPQELKVELISEEKLAPQALKVAPVLKSEKMEDIPPTKKEFVVTSEKEMVPQESKLVPVPKIEKKEGIQLKKKEFLTEVLTSEEKIVPEELKLAPVPKIEQKESISLTKKEFFLTSEEKTLSQELKLAPVSKIDKKRGALHKEFILISEEETEPQEFKVTHVPKTVEEDIIPLKKKELILTSEYKFTTQKLKESLVPKVEEKEDILFKKKEFAITFKEQELSHQLLTVTREPQIKEKEQVLLKKKIDLTSKEAELAPQKRDITLDIGKEIKYLITPKKEEQKTDIITTVPEKLLPKKMEVVTSEKEPQLKKTMIPGVKSEVEEDVPPQKSAPSLKKKEFVPHKKEDTLIPAKDDREVFQKGVTASKGTMAFNALSFLSLHVFLKMNSLHINLYCLFELHVVLHVHTLNQACKSLLL